MSDYAARFVLGLVGNPKDRFSDVAAPVKMGEIWGRYKNGYF